MRWASIMKVTRRKWRSKLERCKISNPRPVSCRHKTTLIIIMPICNYENVIKLSAA
jgi:hypothetical protein